MLTEFGAAAHLSKKLHLENLIAMNIMSHLVYHECIKQTLVDCHFISKKVKDTQRQTYKLQVF